MPLEIVTLPCLADNYTFLVHDTDSGATALVDAPEAAPVMAELTRRGWQLGEIWLTHHHWDHVDAVGEIREATGARVIGAARDAQRLPPLSHALDDGETFAFAGHKVSVLDVSGHTVGHIAYYLADGHAIFTGDSLMALGCGRLFEGTPEQMWASLSRITALPGNTLVYSGHEYAEANARFALTIEPDNPDLQARARSITANRAAGRATVPSLLSLELATNPFLRAGLATVKNAVGMPNEPDAAVFAEIRRRKDAF